jgi:hypothetical protein
MDISPRLPTIPAIETIKQIKEERNNILALIPQTTTEPTLLEITEPELSFEALSSQLQPTCELQ